MGKGEQHNSESDRQAASHSGGGKSRSGVVGSPVKKLSQRNRCDNMKPRETRTKLQVTPLIEEPDLEESLGPAIPVSVAPPQRGSATTPQRQRSQNSRPPAPGSPLSSSCLRLVPGSPIGKEEL